VPPNIKKFNARKKLKAAGTAILAVSRLKNIPSFKKKFH